MTIRLSTLSGGIARASRKSELMTGVARTPIPPPLPPPDAIRSEDDASDENAAEAAQAPGVTSPGVSAAASAPAAERVRQQATPAPLASKSDVSTAPTLRPPPSVVPTTNVAQATLRIGSPPLGSPSPASSPLASPPPASPPLASPPLASPPLGSTAATVPRLAGIPLEERSRREHRGFGFTSVIRHLSLRGWLRWIQSNQCDATLRVRTRDGGSGCIWCSTGKVVDAEWSTMVGATTRAPAFSGEQALMELLRLESGSVSIDFDPVDRPRRIARMTLPLEEESEPGAAELPEPPAAELPEPSAVLVERVQPRRLSRAEYFSGGILLGAFVLVAFAFGRQRAAGEDAQGMVVEPRRAQETQALLPPPVVQKAPPRAPSADAEPKDLSLIRFATLEVEPARAEIWLDHSLLGLGHVELAPLLDEQLHELRFVAAGRAPRSLYFVGSPPSGRVVLEQAAAAGDPVEPAVADAPPPEAAAMQGSEVEHSEASARAEPAPRAALRGAARRRSAPVVAAAPNLPASLAGPASSGKATPSKKAPQIQLIEAHTPRVQVLD